MSGGATQEERGPGVTGALRCGDTAFGSKATPEVIADVGGMVLTAPEERAEMCHVMDVEQVLCRAYSAHRFKTWVWFNVQVSSSTPRGSCPTYVYDWAEQWRQFLGIKVEADALLRLPSVVHLYKPQKA